MSKLIALVATAVLIGGERTIVQPGQPLPELPAHDERELLQSGAAEHPEDTAALARAEAWAAENAAAEFEAARQKVLRANASTVVPVPVAVAETAPAVVAVAAPVVVAETTPAVVPDSAPAKPAAKAGVRK